MAKITEIPSHCLPRGTLLNGKYEIETVIGAGGFGITYKGHDRLLDIAVAVKEYYPNGYANRYAPAGLSVSISEGNNTKYFIEWKDKFLNEARVLAKFSNVPGIVTVRDYFEENDTAYIVMEYLDGINLKRYVKKNGPFGAEEIGQKMIPLLNSLNKIHSKNLIHRDISPENIMLMPDGTLKLYDFGAARDFANQSGKSMSILLKPGYAPEEQYRSRGKQGPYTDVYALCATMYYCVTGTVPDESVQRVFKDEIKSPSELGVSIPAYIENAIMKGMRIRAEERYQDAAALALALGGNDVSENNIVINNDFDGFDDEGKYDGSVSKRFTKSNMVSRGTATLSKEKQEETSDETVYLTKMKENSVSDETVFLTGAVSVPSDGTAEQEKQTETVSEETTPASPAPAEAASPKKKSKVLIPVICAAACIVLFGGIYLASGAFRNSVPVAEEQTATSAAAEESTVQTTTTAATTTTSAATTSQTTTSPEMTTAETTTGETTTGQMTTAETTTVQTTPQTTAETTTAETTTKATTAKKTTKKTTTTPPETTKKTTTTEKPAIEADNSMAEDFEYVNYFGGVKVTKYNGYATTVNIPAVIDGKQVVSLGDNIFENESSVQKIVIPEGVVEIGKCAFLNSSSIREIELPDSLEIISANAFYGCSRLRELYIPANVYSIDYMCFGWTSLEKFEVDSNNKRYYSEDGVLFDREQEMLVFYPMKKKDKTYTIPGGIKKIGWYSFDRPQYLEKLIISENVVTVDGAEEFFSVKEFEVVPDNQFFTAKDGVLYNKNMTALIAYPPSKTDNTFNVPESVVSIEECGFRSCANLKRIILSGTVRDIHQEAFWGTGAAFEINDKSFSTFDEFYNYFLTL